MYWRMLPNQGLPRPDKKGRPGHKLLYGDYALLLLMLIDTWTTGYPTVIHGSRAGLSPTFSISLDLPPSILAVIYLFALFSPCPAHDECFRIEAHTP